MNEKQLPYLEELLAKTQTTRQDWLFGSKAINAACGLSTNINVANDKRTSPYVRSIRIDGGVRAVGYIMRLSDAQTVAKRIQASNGHQPEQKIIVTAREQPIIYGEDGKQILHAMWDNKRATEALTEEIKALRHDLQTFTKTLS